MDGGPPAPRKRFFPRDREWTVHAKFGDGTECLPAGAHSPPDGRKKNLHQPNHRSPRGGLRDRSPSAGQSTIAYGVFTNHGETTAWSAPRDKTRNTDEGRKTGIPVGFVVEVVDRGVLATFVATDGAVGGGPQVSPRASRRFSPLVDAMIVNLQPESDWSGPDQALR